MWKEFEKRKTDHLRHAEDEVNQATGGALWDAVHLPHEAIPELDWEDVSVEVDSAPDGSLSSNNRLPASLLSNAARWKKPFYIAGMTAGHQGAGKINFRIAALAEQMGWAMGVGSQRREFESKEFTEFQELRGRFPDLVLFGNLGLSQLVALGPEAVCRAFSKLDAEALAIHTNPLQEVMQVEGTPHFKGACAALAELTEVAPFPVILKETGCGFSAQTLNRVKKLKLMAIDVSGYGGTHWGRIEGARASESADPRAWIRARASQTFSRWGVPTALTLGTARDIVGPSIEVWASGGVRSGLDAAKAIALGASRVGYAQPALIAATQGEDALKLWMEAQEFELKAAMFCSGVRSLAGLRERCLAGKD